MEELKELLHIYNSGALSDRQLIGRVKASLSIQKELIEATPFLDAYENIDIVERLYYAVHNLNDIVKCKYCDNKATWIGRGLKDGYRPTCKNKECKSKLLTESRTGSTVISDKRDSEFIEWQNSVTQINDDIVKEHIKYDKFIPLITNKVILDYLNNRFKDSDSIEETLKRIEMGIEEKPKCALPGCDKPVTWIGRKRALFSKFCCPAHSAQSEDTRNKCVETQIKNWGTESCYSSDKYKQQVREKYGVDYLILRKETKEKIKKTNLERYDTIYPSQNEDIKNKMMNTTYERYGYKCFFDVPEVFALSHSQEVIDKIHATNLERYGHISPFGNSDVRKRIEETNIKKYGVSTPLILPEVKEKAYSEETREKIKQTNLKRYSCEYGLSNSDIRKKIEKTNLKKYGYTNPIFNSEVRQKSYETLIKNAKEQKSYQEDEVYEIVDSLFNSVKRHHMTQDFKYNVDIYVEDVDLFIEYQGSHFHNRRAFLGTDEDFEEVKKLEEKTEEHRIKTNKELTQYDNIIYVWTDLDCRKRQTAKENSLNYLEIYSFHNEQDIINQIELWLGCYNNKQLICYSDEVLKNDFLYFKNLRNTDINQINYISKKNDIIKHFQFTEFYKNEMNIYAHDPIARRRVIQNRMKYLNKKEYQLSIMDILTGFKKSGIYYGYSHFNPQYTNWFVNTYNVKTIYDPCGGWGHHLLGMLNCDKVIYNELNKKVSKNVQKMCDYFKLDNVIIHTGDATEYIPDDVDAFFMCPPYYNVELYDDMTFSTEDEFSTFLNSIMNIWKKNKAHIFGILIREDFALLINDKPVEVYDLVHTDSHFTKGGKKKYKERMYIYKKEH